MRKKLILASLTILVAAIAVLSSLSIYMLQRKGEEDVALYRQELLNEIKKGLAANVEIAYQSVAAGQAAGKNPDEILNDVKSIRYDGGVGYFWINDTTKPVPRMIMHPVLPKLNGQIMDDPKFNVAFGRKENLFTAFVRVCEKDGSGFVDYIWPKPSKEGQMEDKPKLSYVKLFAPLNWIIGTGIYIDDVDAMVETFHQQNTSALKSQVIKILIASLAMILVAWLLVQQVFGKTTSTLERLIEISHDLAEGEGDLTKRIQISGQDDVAQLSQNINTFMTKIDKLIKAVKTGALAVAHSTDGIAGGAQQLAQSTQQQAAAVEQVAATIDEMTSSIKNNASNASLGRDKTHSTEEAVNTNAAISNELSAAMTEISASSRRISDIITTVNEVAFQTNLLALNAAVEAARAGEQGKGFAVVAGEVRALAQRSSLAAKEIRNLIEDTVQKIASGDEMVKRSAEALHEIVELIKELSSTMDEIAVSSSQQASGVDELSRAIALIDNSTQHNATTVEELSSTASTIRQEAVDFEGLVRQFKVSEHL